MKKIIIFILIPFLLININQKTNNEDMIRIRVIANSNTKHDQNVKMNVSNNLKNTLYNLLKDEKDINNVRNIINNNIDNLSKEINKTITNENYSYKINYGYNYFPEKEYNGKKYEEGYYESLLVTLGEGNGDNWWCILFPPLCLIEAEESEEEVEYNFFFKKIIDNIFN